MTESDQPEKNFVDTKIEKPPELKTGEEQSLPAESNQCCSGSHHHAGDEIEFDQNQRRQDSIEDIEGTKAIMKRASRGYWLLTFIMILIFVFMVWLWFNAYFTPPRS